MSAPRVDVVLARGTSSASVARAADLLADESGAEIHLSACDPVGGGLAFSPDGEYVAVFAADAVPLPGAVGRMLEAVEASPEALVLGAAVPEGDRVRMQADARRHLQRAARFADASFVTVYGADAIAAVLCRRALVPDALLATLAADGPAAFLGVHAASPCRVVADPVAVQRGARPAAAAAQRVRAALDRVRARPALAPAAVAAALGIEGATTRLRATRQRLARRFTWRVLLPIVGRVHDLLLALLADWPIAWREVAGTPSAAPRRIAYYAWRFPVLSETFIRRELRALAAAGVDVRVLADAPGNGASDDPELAPLVRRTRYVLPAAPALLLRDLADALVRAPLRTAHLFLYVLGRRYDVAKALSQDVRVFLKAVRVAALLQRDGATHLHAPWGDTNAFVGMVAARLAGAEFSVQFRAQDLHRRTLAFETREKIRNARFVVTNARYNLEHLRALAAPADREKIHLVYEGLELERLVPVPRDRSRSDRPVHVVSVARLIEPKGLPDLFAALRILRDAGRDLRCTVIGGPELPRYVNDLVAIRRARRRLGLEDVVTLAGEQPFARVVAADADADVFALPCVVGADGSRDVTPNALLEAMAMGVPVVATRMTGIPELVEDGASGLLVPPNDPAALAAAIARLIDDPVLAARLATQARARVVERFDVAANVGAYAALFEAR